MAVDLGWSEGEEEMGEDEERRRGASRGRPVMATTTTAAKTTMARMLKTRATRGTAARAISFPWEGVMLVEEGEEAEEAAEDLDGGEEGATRLVIL